MRLQETLHLPLSARAAAAMYADAAYPPYRAEALHAQTATAEVDGEVAGAFAVSTELRMPTDGVPDMMKRFVGAHVTVRETQRWDPPAEDGARTGSTDLEVVGAPASLRASLRLTPTGEDACEVAIDGELEARVPLLGRKIEAAAMPYVSRVLGAEQRSAAAYADDHRG